MKKNEFKKQLEMLLESYFICNEDRWSVDETDRLFDLFKQNKKEFINKWAPKDDIC